MDLHSTTTDKFSEHQRRFLSYKWFEKQMTTVGTQWCRYTLLSVHLGGLSHLMVMNDVCPSFSIFPAVLTCHADRSVLSGLFLRSLLPATVPLALAALLREALTSALAWGSFD